MNNVCNPRLNFKCLVISPCQQKFTDPIFEAAKEITLFFPRDEDNIPLTLSDWKAIDIYGDGQGDQLIITGEDIISFKIFLKRYKNRIPVSPEEIKLLENTGIDNKTNIIPYMIRATKLAQKIIEVMKESGKKILEVRTDQDLEDLEKIYQFYPDEEESKDNFLKNEEKLMHGVLDTDGPKNIYLKKALNKIDPTFKVYREKQYSA